MNFDFGSLNQVVSMVSSKVPAGGMGTGGLLLLSLLSLSGLRRVSPLLGSVSRIPVQTLGYRGAPVQGGGLIGSLFTLGAWVSAACAVILLLSPHSLPQALREESALGTTLLFFAVCALLHAMLRTGQFALRIGMWVAVSIVLYTGYGINTNILPKLTTSSAVEHQTSTRGNPGVQQFSISSRGAQTASFQEM